MSTMISSWSISSSFRPHAFFKFVLLMMASSCCSTVQANGNDINQNTRCDESKCRTIDPDSVPGYWWLPPPPEDFSGGYTCWAPVKDGNDIDNESSAYPCAEGYVGRAVPNVTTLDEYSLVLNWYTCCPETEEQERGQGDEVDFDNAMSLVQTCSDAYYDPVTFSGWAAPDGLAPRSCIGDEYPYPRDTGAIIPMDHGGVVYNVQQFLCCAEVQDNTSPDPWDQDGDLLVDSCTTSACTSLDGVGGTGDCFADGVTEPFTCDTKDESNIFVHPTLNGHDDLNDYNFHYVCCKDKKDHHPYEDANEWDGLQIALMVQSVLSMITFLVSSVFTLGILTNAKVRSQSWNIYLVMVSIPDVIYNLFRFIYGLVVITRSNTFIQTTWTIDWFYAVSNLLLNAIIVYEVHKFLRAFRRMVRIPPPAINGVLLQSFVVYAIAAGCGLWMFHLHTVGIALAGEYARFLRFHKVSLCCMVIPPILFVTLICLDVWYRKLLPNHVGRTRTLALYFLRVILVFMVTWLPYLILITIGLQSSRVLGYIGMCISSTQGTLSVAVAMSKTDVQWAVMSFLRGRCNDEPAKEQGEGISQRGASSRNSTRGSVRVSGVNVLAAEAAAAMYKSTDTMCAQSQAPRTSSSKDSNNSDSDDLEDVSDWIREEALQVQGEENTDSTGGIVLTNDFNNDLATRTTPAASNENTRRQQQAPTVVPVEGTSLKGRIDMTGAIVVDCNPEK